MDDPIVHAVLDASVLSAWLLPKSTTRDTLKHRAKELIEARVERYWPHLRLYVPGIAAAETQSVLDRYRLCTWAGVLRNDPTRRATRSEYSKAKTKLADLMQSRKIETLDHPSDHILAAQLVSPANAKYQFRRRRSASAGTGEGKRSIPQPMGAADCMIVACGITLGLTVGADNVVIVTADTRLADVARKLRRLKDEAAKSLGFERTAQQLGTAWMRWMYPRAVNLRTADESNLAMMFQAWPLPKRRWVWVPDASFLEPEHEKELIAIYKEHKAATGVGVDNLPYSSAIDSLRIELVNRTGYLLTNADVYRTLSRMRKAGRFKERP